MELTAAADLAAPPEAVTAAVADLGTYPRWLGIVAAAEPDGPGAWQVTLQGRLGLLVHRKRLRMARTVHEPGHARFERQERDGGTHGRWVLDAVVAPAADRGSGCRLTMQLAYDGLGWVPLLEGILRAEARRAGPRLDALVG